MNKEQIILIVDDNREASALLRTLLAQRGYTVVAASTPAQARERICDGHHDLIVFENVLPDGDGIDLLRELRQTSQAPAIIMTESYAAQAKAQEAGCADFIAKPYTLDMLTTRIERLLCQRSRDAPPPLLD